MRGKTVLLVEDNADNQEIYRIILAHHGFSVLQAWDGECGVQMARHHCPDLILMDLTMPLVDGLEATRMLKADRSTLFLANEKTSELWSEVGEGLNAVQIKLPNTAGIAGDPRMILGEYALKF